MDKLELIVSKIDDLKEEVDAIRKDQIEMKFDVRKNSDNLVIHMKRTDLNEKRLESLENKLTIEYLLKLIVSAAGTIGVVAGAIFTIIKLVNTFIN